MVELDSNTTAATLDVGEENCATLILHVRNAIMPLSPGSVLAVVAYDPSAEIDLRSWCAMTGHGYLGVQDRGDHSLYYLRRRDSNGEDYRVRQLRQG